MKFTTTFIAILMTVLWSAAIELPAQIMTIKPVERPRLQVLAQPDLQVEFPRFMRNPGLLGGIRLTVRNTGKADAGKFFVDFILSSDQKAPIKYAAFSTNWQEDVLVKGGRMHIERLAAGASRTVTLPIPLFKPRGAPGNVYLGAVVDPGKTVSEGDEKNNTAFMKYRFPEVKKVRINSVHQSTVMGSVSGTIELTLNGSGFGATMGDRLVKLGSWTLPVDQSPDGSWVDWSDSGTCARIPSNLHIPFGKTYDLRIVENGQVISNVVRHLLKMDFEGITLNTGGGYIWEAHAGDLLQLHAFDLPPTQGNWTVHFGPRIVPVSNWRTNYVVITCPDLSPGDYDVWFENGSGQDVCLSRRGITIRP